MRNFVVVVLAVLGLRATVTARDTPSHPSGALIAQAAPPTPSPPPAVLPTASPSGSAPPDPADDGTTFRPHAVDVVDYTMRAWLDPAAHTVHGEGTIQWRNTSNRPTRELWMHLYLNAFKNEKSVFMRTSVGRARGNGSLSHWGAIDVRRLVFKDSVRGVDDDLWPNAELKRPGDDDETDARVPLPREIAPNEVITLAMTWDDKLPNVVERTGFDGSFHMIGQWFPKLARLEPNGQWAHFPFYHLGEFYADFGTYDVTLDVPSGFVVGATGPAVDVRDENGRHIERHVQSDVHDFAWTAWDLFQVETETMDGIGVRILYPKGYRVAARRELEATRFAIPHFAAHYGPYPYDVLTIVHPPDTSREAGGMEYPTLITSGGPWYGPPGVRELELVTIHEFGHEYFYGLLASNEVAWPFLDEGINSYAESRTITDWLGPGGAVDVFGLHFALTAMQAVRSRDAAHVAPVAQAVPQFVLGSDYGQLVYSRTATILETMRRVYGDEPVANALRAYARQQRFRHPTPDALLASFADVLGPEAAETLRQALFDRGWVDYEVAAVASGPTMAPAGLFDRGGSRDVIKERTLVPQSFDGWIIVRRRGPLRFPVDVELSLDDGSRHRIRWAAEEASARLPYHGTTGLRSAVIDPDHAVLLDENLTNNHGTVEGHAQSVARSAERLTYWTQLLVQLFLP
jgi:hypothetical protein